MVWAPKTYFVLSEHFQKKDDLTSLDNDFSDFPSSIRSKMTLKEIDLLDREDIGKLLEGMDYVIHLAGDTNPDNVQVKTSDYPRPDDLYGVSKVYMETLASYYSYHFDKEFIGICIGGFDASLLENEVDVAGRADCLSKEDMCLLVDCYLRAELQEPFLLVNGLSNNCF